MTAAILPAPTKVTIPDGGMATCRHCGEACFEGTAFCCAGCDAAYQAITGMGLDDYYQRRLLDPAARAPRPDVAERFDLQGSVRTQPDGAFVLHLAVDGVQCGACVWLIEQVLARQPGVQQARVNMTSCRLTLVWRGTAAMAPLLAGSVERLGYRLVPYDPGERQQNIDRTGRALLRALAVAGFAAGNVMLLSIGIWAGITEGMGPATRTLLHWVSALISMPAIAYAGQPFFRSAWNALRHRRTNMDVPISVGVLLVTAMSLVETIEGGTHTYFDSAVTLLFFLLIGRVLDHRARGMARATAERLLALRDGDVTIVGADVGEEGALRRCRARSVALGDRVLVGMGERIGVDGVILSGQGLLDTTLVTGETVPAPATVGDRVFAGMVNLGAAITLRATAIGEATLLAEMARLIDAAEGRRGRFVVLADRVARAYAPAVHLCALATFLFWVFAMGMAPGEALLIACAVLIITCPCALALAVPAAQVIATGALFRAGILLKSGTALERLAAVDVVVFDKTGTLSEPELALVGRPDTEALAVAATLAATSRHPLARALAAATGRPKPADGVVEHPGLGLSLAADEGETRLGSAAFCDVAAGQGAEAELWLRRPGIAPVRFAFAEAWRRDAAITVGRLAAMGIEVRLLSGDREAPVRRAATVLGIAQARGHCSPAAKMAEIEALRAAGHAVMMVGDGLNDGPCLAAASVSMSPSSAAEISQNVADLVFQGRLLGPVCTAIGVARRTQAIMRQNVALAIGYNVLVVPVAAAGFVTPWLAAAAMSISSIMVMANSLRLRRRVDA